MRALNLLIAPLCLAAGVALAQDPMSSPPLGKGRDLMATMDTDRDGSISRQEFLSGHVQADAYFAKLDGNKDGAVSRDEFMAEPAGPKRSQRFQQLDTNADGRITREEVDARRTARFDRLDANHDGKLSAEEMASRRGGG